MNTNIYEYIDNMKIRISPKILQIINKSLDQLPKNN